MIGLTSVSMYAWARQVFMNNFQVFMSLATISYINYWLRPSQLLRKNYGNSGMVHFEEINQTLPLLNVAAYWKSSNTEACTKKLSQTLLNNIDNGGVGTWSQNLWRYCSSLVTLHSSKSLHITSIHVFICWALLWLKYNKPQTFEFTKVGTLFHSVTLSQSNWRTRT